LNKVQMATLLVQLREQGLFVCVLFWSSPACLQYEVFEDALCLLRLSDSAPAHARRPVSSMSAEHKTRDSENKQHCRHNDRGV